MRACVCSVDGELGTTTRDKGLSVRGRSESGQQQAGKQAGAQAGRQAGK